jgi:ATP adenylyltransferase
MAERPLWAPWRIEYVTGPKDGECIFCAAASSTNDKAHLVIERGRRCFTMLNAFPYAPGHLMIVPYRHVDGLQDLADDDLLELMQLARRAIAAMSGAMSPAGFNVGLNLGAVAGAGIDDHLHLHVVPRWQGDTNFMPVLADTHVLPQSLDAAREVLVAAVGRLPPADSVAR